MASNLLTCHSQGPGLSWAFSWRTELAKAASFWMVLVHHSERTKLPRSWVSVQKRWVKLMMVKSHISRVENQGEHNSSDIIRRNRLFLGLCGFDVGEKQMDHFCLRKITTPPVEPSDHPLILKMNSNIWDQRDEGCLIWTGDTSYSILSHIFQLRSHNLGLFAITWDGIHRTAMVYPLVNIQKAMEKHDFNR